MFRFTIRDVLWLTVVMGVAAGWFADHYWQSTAVYLIVTPQTIKSRLRVGEVLELEHLPNGEISERVVPASRRAPK